MQKEKNILLKINFCKKITKNKIKNQIVDKNHFIFC